MNTLLKMGAAGLMFASAGQMAQAAVLLPDSITATYQGAAADGSITYTDDLYLDTLTFSNGRGRGRRAGRTAVYDGTNGGFSAARTFTVTEARGKFNAEWGDDDDTSDGDGNPLDKAGFPLAEQETGNAGIQDRALLEAVNSRSISEITDGEDSGFGSYVVEFDQMLAADGVMGDELPDIVFLERGGNDTFTIELLLGGTVAAPIYSNAVTMNSGDFWGTGLSIDTVEIGSGQEVFLGGFDFSDFGLATTDFVRGFRMSTSDGPDLAGFFLVTEDPTLFEDPPTILIEMAPVPLPASAMLLLGGFGALAGMRRVGGRREA